MAAVAALLLAHLGRKYIEYVVEANYFAGSGCNIVLTRILLRMKG